LLSAFDEQAAELYTLHEEECWGVLPDGGMVSERASESVCVCVWTTAALSWVRSALANSSVHFTVHFSALSLSLSLPVEGCGYMDIGYTERWVREHWQIYLRSPIGVPIMIGGSLTLADYSCGCRASYRQMGGGGAEPSHPPPPPPGGANASAVYEMLFAYGFDWRWLTTHSLTHASAAGTAEQSRAQTA
jgi:hypothetical protein